LTARIAGAIGGEMRPSYLRSHALLLLVGGATAATAACATSESGAFEAENAVDNTDEEDAAPGALLPEGGRADASSPSPTLDASTKDSSTSGSKDAGTKDSGTKDSSVGIDASVDAGPTTSLYFLGDFATNGVVQLGLALVPTASANPIAITSGAQTAKQVVAFDVAAGGAKLVVAADLVVTGRFDVVALNANGTGAAVIATMPASAKVTDISISPDGTKVAYVADAETAGAYDVYVVPTAGGVAPVRVSPTRAAANAALDAQSIAWSRDSVYLAIAGDFTIDKKNELHVVDTSAAVPAPVAALAESALPAPAANANVGVNTGLRPVWTSGGKVCVKADLTGTLPAKYRLYCAAASGAGFAVPANFPALPAQVGSYGISPDGATLAFAADTTTTDAYEIYTMKADDSAPPVRITSGTVTVAAPGAFRGPAFSTPLGYSPDGTKIAFIADIVDDGRNELYVVAADGATTEKRVALVGPAHDLDRDVQTFAWAPDSSSLAFVCDHAANNDFAVFRVPNVTTADQAPVLVRGVAASGDVTDLSWQP
jgi:hypothetical protein